jgi:hypothetical protein
MIKWETPFIRSNWIDINTMSLSLTQLRRRLAELHGRPANGERRVGVFRCQVTTTIGVVT